MVRFAAWTHRYRVSSQPLPALVPLMRRRSMTEASFNPSSWPSFSANYPFRDSGSPTRALWPLRTARCV